MLNLVVKNHTALLAYSSGGWKATMGLPGLKPRSRQSGFLREAPGENESVSLPFPVPSGRSDSLAHGSSFSFEASDGR